MDKSLKKKKKREKSTKAQTVGFTMVILTLTITALKAGAKLKRDLCFTYTLCADGWK